MLESIKHYLTAQGFNNIYIDIMPDAEKQIDAIGLLEWSAPVLQPVGEVTHYVQIQVRRTCYDNAKGICNNIMSVLDSGIDEKLIRLSDNTYCICRPRRAPVIMERGSGYTTFYCEIAVWTN